MEKNLKRIYICNGELLCIYLRHCKSTAVQLKKKDITEIEAAYQRLKS